MVIELKAGTMGLVRWNSLQICNASPPHLQNSAVKSFFHPRAKMSLILPKAIRLRLSSSNMHIMTTKYIKDMAQHISYLRENRGRIMFVLVSGIILCFGSFDSALGQTCVQGVSGYAGEEAEVSSITNEGIVEEAWRVVDEAFLDARHHKWSTQAWLKKKEEVLSRPIQTRLAAHDIIKRMLASLDDPYTHFLTPSEFSKLARYDLTGIGINLKEVLDEDGSTKLKVIGILLGGPAHAAGVKQGDEILSVNGISMKGKTSFEAASLIQGPKETFVSIEVKHGDCGETQILNVERQPTVRTPVYYRLEKGYNENEVIGYIRIKEFNALARKDLVTAMQRLKDVGVSSLVLDLRDNPGGLVQAGIEVAKLFLEGGEIVTYTVGRDLHSQKRILAQNPPLTTAPLMVLVNERTASASEIVASALHDNCRAVLVGERTFGKGLIQSVYELKDGSGVVVTTGKYVTPSHKDIDGNGIEPDFRHRPGLVEAKQNLSRCHVPVK